MFILKPGFDQQKKIFPFLFETVGPIGLKIFLQILDANRGACFFSFLEILFLSNLAGLTKFKESKKHWFFDKVFSILLLVTCENDIFQKGKKHAPRFASSICRKIFSSIRWSPEFCVGENFWSFLALVIPKTLWRRHLRILVLWRTFLYSSRSIYPESFISFRPAVPQKPRKRGCPLKGGSGPPEVLIRCCHLKENVSFLPRSSDFYRVRRGHARVIAASKPIF